MNRFVLNFAEVRSLQELHQYFQKVFDLPEYYGHNMDALWDCLSCCYDENATIVLTNISALPKEMAPSVDIMLELFRDLHNEDGVQIEIIEDSATDGDISGYWV